MSKLLDQSHPSTFSRFQRRWYRLIHNVANRRKQILLLLQTLSPLGLCFAPISLSHCVSSESPWNGLKLYVRPQAWEQAKRVLIKEVGV